MNKPKLTPWFPARLNPVRRGEYEVDRLIDFVTAGVRHISRRRERLIWTAHGWRYLTGAYAAMCEQDGDKWRGVRRED